MKGKFVIRCISIIFSAIMLFGCVPSVFAVATNEEVSHFYTPGAVVVELKEEVETISDLLPELDVNEVKFITPGSTTQHVYCLSFSEQTKEIVWEAIDILKKNPNVIDAYPDYDSKYIRYTPGMVVVGLKYNAPSFEKLLPGFEITETRLITPESTTQNVWSVNFAEETYEIVWEAIDILKESPYVYSVCPNYIGEYLPIEPGTTDPAKDTTEPATTAPVTDATEPETTVPVTDVNGDTQITEPTEDEQFYTPGVVLVGLKKDAPSVEELLPGFEFIEISCITQDAYCVRFSEQTNAIVWEAIDILSKSPYVYACQPDYNSQYVRYTPGMVVVGLKYNAPSFEKLLPGFDITETRLITPESTTQNVFSVKFAEETKEIVWKAIEVLKKSPYVYAADANYIGEYLPVPTSPNYFSNVKGDADGDGVLSVKDATHIQMYLANFISAWKINYSAANVSETGTVTVRDATKIQLKLAGFLNDW